MREPATIYPARKIITMNRHRPFAEAIAVSEGRLLGVGPVEELKSWGEHRIDDSLRDKVLLPGFVEGIATPWKAACGRMSTPASTTAWTRTARSGQASSPSTKWSSACRRPTGRWRTPIHR
ncbi:hypothetical protein [Fodinicurvata halophila]|uniref:hypothetical protein n=1 Tax=Fodinicurvata halophila TaxID=1419723 RepID=UPI00362B0024